MLLTIWQAAMMVYLMLLMIFVLTAGSKKEVRTFTEYCQVYYHNSTPYPAVMRIGLESWTLVEIIEI